jgi:hypothetical protein
VTHTFDRSPGTIISIELPHAIFKGLIWGDRIQDYGGSITFTDKKNDLAYANPSSLFLSYRFCLSPLSLPIYHALGSLLVLVPAQLRVDVRGSGLGGFLVLHP